MKSTQLLAKSSTVLLILLMLPLSVGCPFLPCTTDPVDGVYVNIQVDAELDDTEGLTRIMNALDVRGIDATLYVTGDYANRNNPRIRGLFGRGHEVALHGYYTGEQLATMTYEEQLDLLSRAKQALEGCKPCGTYIPVTGFRPQYFSQNEDTYDVLDELGFAYNSGFKAGLLYAEGHEEDFAPYPFPEHAFHAVPITTVEHNGEPVYLCDIGCAIGLEMTGEEWGEALEAALDEAIANRRPLVVLVHGWYTGDKNEYDYWEPFVDFLDAARCQVTFVTTQELVDLFPEESRR